MGGTISAIADEAETGVRHTVTSFEQLQRLRRVRLSRPAYLANSYLLRGTRSHRAAERCIARLLTSGDGLMEHEGKGRPD
jgi:hypothetical protein